MVKQSNYNSDKFIQFIELITNKKLTLWQKEFIKMNPQNSIKFGRKGRCPLPRQWVEIDINNY